MLLQELHHLLNFGWIFLVEWRQHFCTVVVLFNSDKEREMSIQRFKCVEILIVQGRLASVVYRAVDYRAQWIIQSVSRTHSSLFKAFLATGRVESHTSLPRREAQHSIGRDIGHCIYINKMRTVSFFVFVGKSDVHITMWRGFAQLWLCSVRVTGAR